MRLQQLRKLLNEKNLDAVLISSLPNITYLSNFSGFTTEDRDAYLLITQKKQFIFTHSIYKEVAEKDFKNFTLVEIRRENPMSQVLQDIVEKEKITEMGFEAFDVTVSDYEKLTKHINKSILKSTDLLATLRMRKDINEIEAIKKACALGDTCFTFICKQLKVGITEAELAFEIEYFIKRHGANISFDPIVAFGPNASEPHHIPNKTTLKKNNFVLFDFGTKLSDYCSDMTRTIFFGKPNEKQNKLYHTVLNAQLASVDYLKSKLLAKEPVHAPSIDQVGRDYITEQGYEPFTHSSHGIGLNVHEAPRLYSSSKDYMEEGMVFSIEPGIYLPKKFGIRIEDIFAINNNRVVQLTNAPRQLIEI